MLGFGVKHTVKDMLCFSGSLRHRLGMSQHLHQGLYILLYLRKKRNKEKHREWNDGECLLQGAVDVAHKKK